MAASTLVVEISSQLSWAVPRAPYSVLDGPPTKEGPGAWWRRGPGARRGGL